MEFVEPIRDKRKIEAMKLVLRGSNLRDYCLFVLGINSGLRVSDLLRLNIEDVLNEKGKVLDRITIREKRPGKQKLFQSVTIPKRPSRNTYKNGAHIRVLSRFSSPGRVIPLSSGCRLGKP
ncbi:hypothetical protein [Alicyclobacillus fastidiosus]|uniref:hypothetical protein n=1 Tax=Alicyclobacillus fastidiosus TaxID=392011 RepID=UPI0032AFFA7E